MRFCYKFRCDLQIFQSGIKMLDKLAISSETRLRTRIQLSKRYHRNTDAAETAVVVAYASSCIPACKICNSYVNYGKRARWHFEYRIWHEFNITTIDIYWQTQPQLNIHRANYKLYLAVFEISLARLRTIYE